jgi:Flp pilus assembly protein TadG
MAAIARRLRRVRGRKGAELIEFALVLPVLLMVVAGIIDFGFLFQGYEVVTNAAREGARIAVLPGYAQADVQARVASYVSTSGLPNTPATSMALATVVTGAGANVDVVNVTVTYPYRMSILGPIASLFGGSFGTITLTAVSSMRTEAGAGS